MSNMREIYHCFMFYWMDYEETFPHYLDPNEKAPMNEWNWKMAQYVCEADTEPSKEGFVGNYRRGIFSCPSSFRTHDLGYGMNVNLKYKSLARYGRQETETVLIGEPEGKDGGETAVQMLAETDSPDFTDESSLVDLRRHINGCNYCFLDGHVIWSPSALPLVRRSKTQSDGTDKAEPR
jgi:prepilin-type processing-associated H-X9-DG protein